MKKIARIIAILCCMAVFAGNMAFAAELMSAMNAYTGSDSIVLYVKNQGRDIDHVYLGNDEAQGFTTEEVGSVRTVVVLDNSLSINKKYRDTIKSFLTDLVAARNDGDTFTIATFAENINYLVQESNDYLNIKAQIDGLEFINQDSYFTNVLYTVINDISKYEDIRYTRVIVIADGVDNEALGYTDDELNKRIQTARVPIYTIGCTSKGNEENLKKMFALSRTSNGKSYLLDDVSGADVLQDILADTDVIKVTVTPQDKSCDGTNKMVRISYGEDYCTTEVTMPFKAVVEETTTEPVKETVKETVRETTPAVPETTKAPEPEPEPAGPGMTMILAIGGIVLVLVVIIIVVIVVVSKKRKSVDTESSSDLGDITKVSKESDENGNSHTKIIGEDEKDDESNTAILGGNRQPIKLYLQDMDDSSRTFEYPVRDKIFIGKSKDKCQIVINYSEYISKIHCEVFVKGNILYVRDGGGDIIASKNGTFVNGKKVAPEAQLPSGCILKLAQVRFKVTYK